MKASEAKLLTAKAHQIKETVNKELELIYSAIKQSALEGMVSWHYCRGWLDSKRVDNIRIENTIVETLKSLGYEIKKCYSNPNQPFIIISWS